MTNVELDTVVRTLPAASMRGGWMRIDLPVGVPTGIGSLPHRDPHRAAAFALGCSSDLPSVPTLPRRSPAESMIAQAVVGIHGITVGQYASLAVDLAQVDPAAGVETPLDHGAFESLRAFLSAAQVVGPTRVKWQIVGPITLGLALMRAGVPVHTAFEVAVRAVRCHVAAIRQRIDEALPGVGHVVFLDEPALTDVRDPGFPVPAEAAIDYLSGALAAIETFGISGVHCCGNGDWSAIVAAGPGILSVPVHHGLVSAGGLLADFLDAGGWVAWGVIATDGPIPLSVAHPWRQLNTLWAELVGAGCDRDRLAAQALVTPACGLTNHAESVAERIMTLVRDVAHRLGHEQRSPVMSQPA